MSSERPANDMSLWKLCELYRTAIKRLCDILDVDTGPHLARRLIKAAQRWQIDVKDAISGKTYELKAGVQDAIDGRKIVADQFSAQHNCPIHLDLSHRHFIEALIFTARPIRLEDPLPRSPAHPSWLSAPPGTAQVVWSL